METPDPTAATIRDGDERDTDTSNGGSGHTPLVSIFVTFLTTIISITANSTGSSGSSEGDAVVTTDPYPLRLSDAVDELEVSLRQLSVSTIRTVSSSSSSSSNHSHHNQNLTNDVIVSDMCELWYQSLWMIHWLVEQLLMNETTVEDEATTLTQTIEPHDLTRIVSHLLLSSSASSVSSSKPSSCIPTNTTTTTALHLPRIRNVTDHAQFHTLLSHLRKIPLLVLDDLTDVFTTTQAHQFWTRTLLTPFLRPVPKNQCRRPDAHPLFFSNPLWYTNRTVGGNVNPTTSSGTNPSWLLFLKITNKLIRRLQQSSERHMGISTCKSSLSSPMVISLLLQLLSTVYSMSEKSSTRVWGSYNEHKAVVANVGTTNQAMATSTSTETTLSIAQDSSHDLYTIFWKLQDDFRHPNGIVVSDFIHRLQLMLRTMETSHTGIRRSTTTSKQMNETSLDQLHCEMNIYILSTPFGLSHDDRILTIQLQQDATIRNILFVQMYMILHHLLIQVPLLRTQIQSHLQTLGSIVRSSDENSRKLVHTALHLLNHSEMNWRQWKQQKCLPDIEQPRKQQKKSVSVVATTLLPSRKRKRMDSTSNIDAENGDRTRLMEVSAKMRKKFVPTIQDHFQEYVEALDPEAGIDDEYHPKHDTMFSWQALRLLAFHDRTSSDGVNDATGDEHDDGDYLSQFQHILPNGDYENMIRHVYQTKYNILVPGEGPQPYMYIPEENAEEVNNIVSNENDRNKDGTDNIEGMVTENNKIDAEMIDSPSSPNINGHVDREPDDGGASVSANDASKDVAQNVSIDDVHSKKSHNNPVSNDNAKMNQDQSKHMSPGKVNGDLVSVKFDEKRHEKTKNEISTTGSSIVTEKTNNSRGGECQSNASSKAQSSQRQSSSSSTSGVGERTSSVRTNNHPTGPSQQQQPTYGSNKPRETTVEHSHRETYSRSRNEGYTSASVGASRSYHTMDHGGRLSSRGDVVMKDNVSSSVPAGGRSRDDVPRGKLRDEHHHRGPGGNSSGGDGAPRWDGGEWRGDHPRGQGPDYHHHGRGGSTSSSTNHDRGSGRDHNNRGTTGPGGTGSSSYRSRNNGSTWPRDMDSSNSRR